MGMSLEVLGLVVLLLEGVGALSLLSGYLFRTCCIILTVLFGFYCFNYFNIGYKTLMLFSLGLTTVFVGMINTDHLDAFLPYRQVGIFAEFLLAFFAR